MLKLAFRGVFRQKAHTLMAATAIMSGVIGLILVGGWVNDIFVQLGEALIHSQSGHMQVYREGFYAAGSRTPEKYLIADPTNDKKHILNTPGVENVMVRLNFAGLLNNGRADLSVNGEGVEPGPENELGSFVSMSKGRHLTDQDAFGIVLGYGVAQGLKLKPGDHVTLLANTLDGALNSMEFEVIGIFQSFSKDYDARTVKIPLAAAQELLDTRGGNAIVITLKETDDTESVAGLLKEQLRTSGLEVKTWFELNDFYGKTVELYKGQFGVLQVIILVMVLLSVFNSVNMSVFDRIGEFGTMMALGNRSRQVFWLILTESVVLGIIASTLGLVLGIAMALVISAIGIPMPPPPNADLGYTAQIRVTSSVLLISFVIGFAAAVLAAILPARHVSRTPVVEALRQNF